LVIGGGIFGVSSAWHLARLGVPTTLINEGPLAGGASGRSLSWLNSARRRSSAYHRLRMAGIDRYRTLFARYPQAAWLRFDGGLTWDGDGGNEIAAIFAHERGLGYDAVHLRAEEVARLTPGVDARAIPPQGAIFNAGEGWVDLPLLIGHLARQFAEMGGTIVTDQGRASLLIEHGRTSGARAGDGTRHTADAVLIAAGADVPRIAAEVGFTIADSTPISLLLRTEAINHTLRAVLNTPRVAIRPTPDGAFVLDSAWSEEEVTPRGDGTYEVRESTIAGLLAEASRVLEGNPKLGLRDYGVGPKPIPGDGEPVLGALPNVEGCYVAFSHSGATLGLIAGELLAEEIATGRKHPLLQPFRPERFKPA
jgi:glycine/D-amino acid oxidase-like deaminating enzyme